MRDLEERLVACIPAASYEMESLCRLAGVGLSREVPSAAIECRDRPRLVFNPDFIERHCQSDEHLFLLAMHELWHVLLAHTRLYPRVTILENIAFDAIINAGLCREFPGPEYRGFFEAINPADSLPGMLLRPPPGWPAAPVYPPGPAGTLVFRLYPPPESTCNFPLYAEILDLLAQEVLTGFVLVGSHDDSDSELQAMEDPLFAELVRRIVAAWPPRRPGDAAGAGAPTPAPAAPRGPPRGPARGGPWPAGPRPRAERPALRTPRRARGPSGWLPRPAAPGAAADGGPPGATGDVRAFQFSTVVEPLHWRQLARGSLKTTLGTSIGCVADHLAERRAIRRVLLVTDGYTGVPTPEQRARLAGRKVQVALTPGGWRTDLQGLAATLTELPEL